MTPSRNVRVPDELWGPGMNKAVAEGTTLAAKIRGWIEADLHGQLQTAAGPPPNGDGPDARCQLR